LPPTGEFFKSRGGDALSRRTAVEVGQDHREPSAVPQESFSAEDRDYLIRTIVFEAEEEPEVGKAAVGHVVLNRIKSGLWGDTIKEVVTSPWQFEPWMSNRKQMMQLSPNDRRYQGAAQIADAVLTGGMPDPTAGATHFLNPTIVRKRRGGTLPSWAGGEGQQIGRHTFYALDESGSRLSRNKKMVTALEDDPCSFPQAGV
jgi:spore germination cell wall hydrolase CwlJ-like protein